jgi:hypothetical protein
LKATSVLTVGWWLSSIAVPYLPQSYENPTQLNPIILNVANAKEMASGSGSRVNKDPESLLRYGLPIQNKEVCIAITECVSNRWFYEYMLTPLLSHVHCTISIASTSIT